MYEISEKTMQAIKNEFTTELENRRYEFSYSAIDEIFNEWFTSKQMLLSLLSKHPNWNPEKLMVHFNADFARKLNTGAASDFIEWVQFEGNTLLCEDAQLMNKFSNCLSFMWKYCTSNTYLPDSCLTETISGYDDNGEWFVNTVNPLEKINELIPELHARVGQKNTKIVGKICAYFGIDKVKKYGSTVNYITGEIEDNVLVDSYDKQFAKFCDAISPIKITRHTCISLNPVDYLLMSNGNSWRSCHYIGDDANDAGCYSSGTISYMLDEHSIIFYTVDANFIGDCIERELKIQRQVFGYNDFQIVQSRLYPQNNDYGAADLYTDIRNIMQKVIADCLKEPNRWIKKKVNNVVHGNGATCYADWSCQGSLCSTSVLRGKENDTLASIILGAQPICVDCGKRHSYSDNINECYDSIHCERCGSRIGRDDVYWVGDDPYCYECVEYCDCCDSYVPCGDVVWIESERNNVCSYCLSEYYELCEECDEYVYTNDIHYVNELGEYICDDCLNRGYVRCEACGEYVAKYDVENGLCPDCAEKANDEEEE